MPPPAKEPGLHTGEAADREVSFKYRFAQAKEWQAIGQPIDPGAEKDGHGEDAQELAERLK
jgi:hypothetical protein